MTTVLSGLSSGIKFILEGAAPYFRAQYGNKIKVLEAISDDIAWLPSLHFKIDKFTIVAVEGSEDTPYPEILRLRHADILNAGFPITVYSICPEDVFLKKESQPIIREMREHGIGIYSIDSSTTVHLRERAIPLVQHISHLDFNGEVSGITGRLKFEIVEAFENYKLKAQSGVKEITEISEALIKLAAKNTTIVSWIGNHKNDSCAVILDYMFLVNQLSSARAAIGGMRNYISNYRNTAHHPPRSKRQAFLKFKDCRHAFLDGLKCIRNFKEALRNLGIKLIYRSDKI